MREKRLCLGTLWRCIENAPLSSADMGAAEQECSICQLLPDHLIARILEILLKLLQNLTQPRIGNQPVWLVEET